MCDTAVYFEIPASHMCDIVNYSHICVQVDYQLSIVVDYSYYQLLLSIVVDYPHMCFICVRVNMCDILRKTVARKTWAIAEVFPT